MKERDSAPAPRTTKAPTGTSAVRRQEITRAMLAAGVSINDLVRRTGYLKHQVQAAVGGRSEIEETTFKVLMHAIRSTSQSQRDVARGDA